MIILPTTSDKITLTTSSTADIECHASYVDFTTSSSTAGRKNTVVTTVQSTAEVVAAPAAATYRTVKTITVTNTHASTTNTITIVHTDGTTPVSLFTVDLLAGWSLHYNERAGWSMRGLDGRDLQDIGTFPLREPTAFNNRVILTGDVVNADAVANTIADVTGLSFAVTSGVRYWFKFRIRYTAASTNTGSRWSVNGPAAPTSLYFRPAYAASTVSETIVQGLTAYDLPAASNTQSPYGTLGNIARIVGWIVPSTDGTLIARFASEVAASAITAKIGSFVEWGTL